jgi:hypothetical protein
MYISLFFSEPPHHACVPLYILHVYCLDISFQKYTEEVSLYNIEHMEMVGNPYCLVRNSSLSTPKP